jgi:uncharacterized membrane protein YkoI
MRNKILLLTALVAASLAAPAGAQGRGPSIEPGWIMPAQARGEERQERRQDILSLRDIVESVRARFGGELISARLERGDQPVYVLRWRMANNEVRDLTVDAVSGQIR